MTTDDECPEGGSHQFVKKADVYHWVWAIICCPCYIPLAFCDPSISRAAPCGSFGNPQETDENGNPICPKCHLTKEEAHEMQENLRLKAAMTSANSGR